MENLPRVSIIVPTYNSEDTIETSLISLIKQNYSKKEITVVHDEGSVDNTKQVLMKTAKDFPQLIHIIFTGHVGRSQARNIGWKNSTGEILFFADADDVYNEDYLDKAVACLLSDSSFGGVTVTGASLKFESTFATECIEVYSRIHRKLTDGGKIAPDWAWVYRRDAVESAGGFDERLNQAEDKDLYLRVKKAGYSFGIVPGINWRHTRKGNMQSFTKKSYLAGKRRIMFMLKHNRVGEFFKDVILFWILCGALLASIFFTQLFYLILIGIAVVLGYNLFVTLKVGWNVVRNKKYLFYYPLFKTLTYFASAIGHTHGFLLVCFEKITGRRIDWSRV
jgi:glycosyltransferase involved in cell wall biosynthesis